MSVRRFLAALHCLVTLRRPMTLRRLVTPRRPITLCRPVTLCFLMTLTCLCGASAAVAAETQPRGKWPLAPRPEVVRSFDPPSVEWGSGHRGVDLLGSAGQQVRAALPGRVSFVGRIAGIGMVSVDHGPTRTTYQPVSPTVAVGDRVSAGSVLGTLDWYGTHCLPRACLHWGLLKGDTYLDPLTLVGGPRPVRLLPLTGGSTLPLTGGAARASGSGGAAAPVLSGQLPHVPLRVLTPWG